MAEAFLKKQPWPHLDRAIAEAGKQLVDFGVFSTQIAVASIKKPFPRLCTPSHGGQG